MATVFSCKTLLAFALIHFVLQGQLPVIPRVSPPPTFAFQSSMMKRTTSFGVSSRRSCMSSYYFLTSTSALVIGA